MGYSGYRFLDSSLPFVKIQDPQNQPCIPHIHSTPWSQCPTRLLLGGWLIVSHLWNKTKKHTKQK